MRGSAQLGPGLRRGVAADRPALTDRASAAILAAARRLQSRLQVPPLVRKLLSFAASAAILAFLLRALADIGWTEIAAVLPRTPAFYLLVAASYLALPGMDFVIFRRWWPIGASAIPALLKKRVLNDAVLGHSGDAWFFLWVRSALAGRRLRVAPLAAVKDVAIMSALAGNVATLTMLGLAFGLGGGTIVQQAFAGAAMRPVVLGFAVVISISLLILLFSRKLLSLPRRELGMTFLLHLLRLTAMAMLLIAAWALALPEIAIGTWIVLEALQLVVTRLPFVPNKELLFAAISVTLTGDAAPAVAALMAAAGALYVLGHALSYAVASLASGGRAASR